VTIICSQDTFRNILEREDARAKRSGNAFSVVDFYLKNAELHEDVMTPLLEVLHKRLRSTDEVGWLNKDHIGVVLYNTAPGEAQIFVRSIMKLIPVPVRPSFTIHTYPKGQHRDSDTHPGMVDDEQNNSYSNTVNPETNETKGIRELDLLYAHAMPLWKRTLDVIGSSVFLLIFSPLFLAAACLIKLVSPGPILFKQSRIGYGGKLFILYKFRTMEVNPDTEGHQRYLRELIHDDEDRGESAKSMIKLEDPGVIPCGRILRSTGVDELPQLFNVLRGEMSLVGPRPPIPYEVKEYARWHDGRFDTVPGITGLWQVSGKNALTFKQMVRLDIRYARQMSFWLDVKILCATPLAIYDQLRSSLKRKSQKYRD
jgi:lipopolysaccharide/colanic/teichoic acid biosynthesis glycosyltransferase